MRFALLAAFLVACMHAAPRYAVFRTEDQGKTWSRSDGGLPAGSRINAFGAVGSIVLVGTDSGLYRSRDYGRNWTRVLDSVRILSFASLGNSVYAGTYSSGVLTSSDGGLSWNGSSDAARFRYVRSMLASSGAIYAGTNDQGVFMSRDGARTWISISQGLPAGAQIFALAGLDGNLFAGLYSKGLYVRAGQGSPWQRVGPVLPLALATSRRTLIAGQNPGGLFRSDDSGANWTPGDIAASNDLGNAPVWELAAGPSIALAGVSAHIYYSLDQGRTWARATTGLPAKSSGIAFLASPSFALAAAAVPPE